jgi:ElaB/YqjD/DUF883 family membrane-anchored ribosome-binding protein
MNPNSHLLGRHYVSLVRCSTNQQTDTSIPDQLKLLNAFGDECGMVHVDDVILDGVSGSTPGARTDTDQIIQRKNERNDFDVLLLQDMSRFTRGGAEHGMKLEYDLNAAGIDVVYASENLPEGDHSGIIKSVGFYAAKQYAKSLSFAVARGMMSSIEQGRMSHSMVTPYGVDRLYVSMDGKPLHIIRNLVDGTQQKLHPDTGAVLAIFAAESGHGRSCHYRMQANERIILVPGDPKHVEAVRHMFRRRLIDGWGGFRIARELERMGIRSAKGKPWCVTTINTILRNTIYTGVGITNKTTQAIYNTRSKNSPKPSKSDRKSLASRRKPAVSVRPKAEWIEMEYPPLRDFLGDLCEKAIEWQKNELVRHEHGHVPKPASKDRHVDSPYFLKGILRSKGGEHPLTGRTVGTPKTRYYTIHRGFTVPETDKSLRRLIPAEPLEKAMLEIIRDILLNAPNLRNKLIAEIEMQRHAVSSDTADVQKLESERDHLRSKIEFVIDSLGTVGQDAVRTKLQELESKLKSVLARIEQATETKPQDRRSAATVADEMIQRMSLLGQTIGEMPPQAIRQLLVTMVRKMEVDMTTKAVQIELAMPDFSGQRALCLDNISVQRHVFEAQMGLRLDSAECRYRRAGRQPCFECQRRRAA